MTNSLLENTLARPGDLMASFTRPPPMFTRQCERASGILHPCIFMVPKVFELLKYGCLCFSEKLLKGIPMLSLLPLIIWLTVRFKTYRKNFKYWDMYV